MVDLTKWYQISWKLLMSALEKWRASGRLNTSSSFYAEGGISCNKVFSFNRHQNKSFKCLNIFVSAKVIITFCYFLLYCMENCTGKVKVGIEVVANTAAFVYGISIMIKQFHLTFHSSCKYNCSDIRDQWMVE